MPEQFTADDKLRCLQRELALRERVYPARVATGRMKQAEADREIACIKSMIADYQGARQ